MKKLSAVAVAALAVIGAVVISLPDSTVLSVDGGTVEVRADPLQSPRVLAKASRTASELQTSKLGVLSDGGVVAYFEALDSGILERIALDVMPCARRPQGKTDCRKRLVDGGLVDPGDWNRFLATDATGAECELCPCSVWAGDDSTP
jgi:hypothetical protein